VPAVAPVPLFLSDQRAQSRSVLNLWLSCKIFAGDGLRRGNEGCCGALCKLPSLFRITQKNGGLRLREKMKTSNQQPSDGKLSVLLRESRPSPELPPRFRESVWRRIEINEPSVIAPAWVELLAGLLLKPRFAVAVVCAFVLVGVTLGSIEGAAQARHNAQERYVAAVTAH